MIWTETEKDWLEAHSGLIDKLYNDSEELLLSLKAISEPRLELVDWARHTPPPLTLKLLLSIVLVKYGSSGFIISPTKTISEFNKIITEYDFIISLDGPNRVILFTSNTTNYFAVNKSTPEVLVDSTRSRLTSLGVPNEMINFMLGQDPI